MHRVTGCIRAGELRRIAQIPLRTLAQNSGRDFPATAGSRGKKTHEKASETLLKHQDTAASTPEKPGGLVRGDDAAVGVAEDAEERAPAVEGRELRVPGPGGRDVPEVAPRPPQPSCFESRSKVSKTIIYTICLGSHTLSSL